MHEAGLAANFDSHSGKRVVCRSGKKTRILGGYRMKTKSKDIFVIGFALFSMFFGAGNVIFPPYLGLQSGPQWFLGFLCYFIADIGLALVALFAILKCGKGSEGITERIGHIPSTILMSAIVLCIGPLVAIPRTSASTFEMSIAPLFPNFSPVVFSILFFLLILLLCLNESAVVDIVGKFLTPALMLGLLVLIAKGVFTPMGPVALEPLIANVPESGIKAGYQTMDVLAAMVFGIILLKSAEDKGHKTQKDKFKVVAGAGIVAAIGLLVVYLGLTYLGAAASSFYDVSINRSVLVVNIVEALLGKAGVIIFGIVVALACVTTAVALVSSAAAYFAKITHEKLSYTLLVFIFCGFSAVVSNIGLDQIVSVAGPILDIVYPPALVLIVLSYFSNQIHNGNVFKLATAGALLTSLLGTISSFGVSMPFLSMLPLANLGFGWVLPAAVFGLVGMCIKDKNAPTPTPGSKRASKKAPPVPVDMTHADDASNA